ncbi:MAG TPA: N-acetylmuramoyl-L-alanine amidase, partial [Gemmatimonadales bacterium]|nr:N-acetylmuramoyl-L-alanine amidase [Gemmatimonadales bacterium]
MLAALLCAASAATAAGQPDRAAAPLHTVVVATSRGQIVVPVSMERGHPALPVPPLVRLLPLSSTLEPDWASLDFAGQSFRFLLDAPVMLDAGTVVPLVGGAYLARDTLFLPLQWLTDFIPRRFHEGYRFDPLAGRFEEASHAPVVRTSSPPVERHPVTGLRLRRTVAIDAGHGGDDPGTPCIFCPKGVTEKHVTLAIARRVQQELERRGIRVVMTRTTDVFLSRFERAGYCRDDCDLFVSIHVDALDRGPGYQRVSGIHSYFLGEARTADARRVAALENQSLRYEADAAADDPRMFILKSLQANEILRESALLAELVQNAVARVHPGGDRGVAQAGLAVLNTATRPAILIETGYGTNRGDAR